VHDVVVVGAGRPFPVLIVETVSLASSMTEAESHDLKLQIVQRMEAYNRGKFIGIGDRVDDARRIILVDRQSLLRTQEKGNVR
jgi:hypothetical protein